MTVQDLIDELMLVKDKSKEIRVYPASLSDMSIKEKGDIVNDHFDDTIAIELHK